MMTIEEQIIYEKLKNYTSPERKKEFHTESVSSDFGEKMAGIKYDIEVLNNYKNCSMYQYIAKTPGVVGYIKWFIKRAIRKINCFWAKPVCDQQTSFNMVMVQQSEKIFQSEKILYDKIEESRIVAKNDKQELSDRIDALQNSINQLQNVSDKIDVLQNNINQLQNVSDLRESSLSILGEKVSDIEYKIGKLDELDVLKYGVEKFYTSESYAQSGEDSIIQYILKVLDKPIESVTYLDLGANHAKELSNTFAFYKRGARGVLVEANPELIPELKLYRSEDIIINKCLADSSGEKMKFYVLSGDGLSTSDFSAVQEVMKTNPNITIKDEVEVESVTITEILNKHFSDAPTLLNIDIEGQEYSILERIDFNKVRPSIVIVEMIEYSLMLNKGKKNEKILEYMKNRNYIEYAFTGINSIFVDSYLLYEKELGD